MRITTKLCISVDFEKRNPHVGQGGAKLWIEVVKIDGYSFFARRIEAIRNPQSISRKIKCDLEVLSHRSDFGDISDIVRAPTSKQDRSGRVNNSENTVTSSGYMFTNLLIVAVNITPGSGKADRKEMLRDLGEIDELNTNDE